LPFRASAYTNVDRLCAVFLYNNNEKVLRGDANTACWL